MYIYITVGAKFSRSDGLDRLNWTLVHSVFSSFTDRMFGAVPIRLCILFDAEHARSNRKYKKTTTTSEIRVYLGVRSCGITGQLLTPPRKNPLSAQENMRSMVLKDIPNV